MRVRCWHTAAVINNHSSRDLISSFLPICRIIAVAVCPGQTDAFVYSLERSFKLTSLGEGNRDTAVPAEGNGDLQTLICVLLCETQTMSNPVPWQNWMEAYLGYTLRMKRLFRGWPVMVYEIYTKRRRLEELLWNILRSRSCCIFACFLSQILYVITCI